MTRKRARAALSTTSRAVVLAAVLVIGAGLRPAFAQGQSGGPRLFEFQPGASEPSSAWGARFTAYQAWDQNLFNSVQLVPGRQDAVFTKGGYYSGVRTDAGYQRLTRHTRLTFQANGEAQYFSTLNVSSRDNYGARATFGALTGPHTYLELSAVGTHVSSFGFTSLSNLQASTTPVGTTSGDLPSPTLVGFGVASEEVTATAAQRLSDKSDLRGRYSAERMTYEQADIEIRSQRVQASVTRRYSKAVLMELTYEYREWRGRPSIGTYRIHTVFGEATAALTPRTSLSLRAGASVSPIPHGDDRLDALAEATIRHTFNRAWKGGLGYLRETTFIDGIAAPVTSDFAHAELEDAVTRRLSVQARVGYLHGRAFGTTGQRSYDNAQAGIFMDYAIADSIRAFVRYDVYRYDSAVELLIDRGVPGALNRQSAMVGVTVWAGRRLQ